MQWPQSIEPSDKPLSKPVAARSEAQICGRLLAGIAVSNPAAGHGYLSRVNVVCCQVEVYATNWSFVQRIPTECGVSECVCVFVCDRNVNSEAVYVRVGLLRHREEGNQWITFDVSEPKMGVVQWTSFSVTGWCSNREQPGGCFPAFDTLSLLGYLSDPIF